MTAHDAQKDLADLPKSPVDKLVGPIAHFMHVEAASGIVLVLAAVTAVVLANSSMAEGFLGFWKTSVGFRIGDFEMFHSLKHWINDGLMAVFFFVIGLEVKREIVLGELRDPARAALPVFAALGGMVVPAGAYLLLQAGQPGAQGWGIPMATDIAFVVGCLALLGPRVPNSLRILLLSLAIADDIGAILVIAVGYTDQVHLLALGLGFAGIALVAVLNRIGVRSLGVYIVVGAAAWFGFHESGVHATLAGVILGLMTPAHGWVNKGLTAEVFGKASGLFHGEGWQGQGNSHAALRHMETAARESVSPVERLEHALHPWVGYFIMPVFALANAGVVFEMADLGDPVALAIVFGLGVGKPVGVLVFSWMAVKLRVASLPEGVTWGGLAAGGVLTGIGFTMALFIAGLALEGDILDASKVGILAISTVCAIVGTLLLRVLLPAPDPAA
jgi:NhaA family Na+:H+ antiporter